MISIRYNKKAKDDLENIYLTIRKDKKSVADEFIGKIDEYILLLSSNPKMGKECRYKGLKQDCRVLFFKSYMIVYGLYKTHISIKRIINTKQNYKG